MPSEVMLQLWAGFNERLQQIGQRFQVVRSSANFVAIMIEANPIEPGMEVGDDIRELASIEGRRDIMPAIQRGDVILQLHPLYALEAVAVPIKWKVVRRTDNNASFVIKYWMVKITEGDDGF